MFDNPEKLFILFVIALLIFGPSKLATLGGSLGRSIRDFRSAVRGAHDEFRSAVQEHIDTVNTAAQDLAPALPAPDALADYNAALATPASPDAETLGAPDAMTAHDAGAAVSTFTPPGGPDETGAPAPGASAPVDEEDPSSLVSEPTAAALRESLSR